MTLLAFEEGYAERVWGGNTLRTLYGKDTHRRAPRSAKRGWLRTARNMSAWSPMDHKQVRRCANCLRRTRLGSSGRARASRPMAGFRARGVRILRRGIGPRRRELLLQLARRDLHPSARHIRNHPRRARRRYPGVEACLRAYGARFYAGVHGRGRGVIIEILRPRSRQRHHAASPRGRPSARGHHRPLEHFKIIPIRLLLPRHRPEMGATAKLVWGCLRSQR